MQFKIKSQAERFSLALTGLQLCNRGKSRKVTACAPAKLQGYAANVEYFRLSAMNRKSIPEEYKPLLLDREGTKLDIPRWPEERLRPILKRNPVWKYNGYGEPYKGKGGHWADDGEHGDYKGKHGHGEY